MSRKHISVQVKLAASFTFEHFMVGNYRDHETFAHTVNCMRLTTTATRTTKRTLPQQYFIMDIRTIKIMSNIFSFLVDQLVNIPIVLAQKQWLKLMSLPLWPVNSSWFDILSWSFRSYSVLRQTTATKRTTLTATILYSSTPHRWTQGFFSRTYSIYFRKQMGEVRLTAWISCVRYSGGN